MNWVISTTEDLVIVKTSGVFNLEQIKEMSLETFSVASSEKLKKVLGDHRDMTPQVSVFDTYILPRDLIQSKVPRPISLAIVFSEGSPQKEVFNFFEVTALNAGMYLKMFTNIKDACSWLGINSNKYDQY
jgi:hypothetical protein